MTEHTLPQASALGGWRKSTYSDGNGGSCLEVVDTHPTGIPVRDSKNPNGPALCFTTGTWGTFVSAVKADRLAR
ncbi:DUF397 domain-containing protein [Streptomyces sp. NA04227]|uniref:DUF397 domain-containing protein n=1 Tax=Streptomyces sp. NA04227 TaxID=2742136 RepID=UPI00159277B6|nr:DUF397 domain-containing protein [Streptomyces sp. NA04227]QKW06551.1 DUF397 domain-containing protein [Streptomyces sp. NA04227]